MIIYFARSIRGEHAAMDQAANRTIIDTIRASGHTLAFAINPPLESTGDEYIYQRDIHRLNESQAVIAEVSNPSLGVGYELAYAKHVREIPIFCVARKDVQVSAMVRPVHEYRDLAHLEALIKQYLIDLERVSRV